jgi:hypothetical protein
LHQSLNLFQKPATENGFPTGRLSLDEVERYTRAANTKRLAKFRDGKDQTMNGSGSHSLHGGTILEKSCYFSTVEKTGVAPKGSLTSISSATAFTRNQHNDNCSE